MGNRNVLDCTLRDGGYINDWRFGEDIIRDIIFKLVEAKTDYVEIGFLRNCQYSGNATLFNSISEAKQILPNDKRNTKFSLMALHNNYDINKLEDNDGETIDIIRVTFHDYDIDEGLDFCKEVIKKGYKCFCNPINIMGYSDENLLRLIEKVNEMHLYGFSIVDTFGAMMRTDLMRIYSIVEHNLDSDIAIGLHLHENLSLAYSLAQDFIKTCANKRNVIIDGSLLGMGRVPGNLCIELFMDYMNRNYSKEYEINFVLDAIDEYIIPIKNKSKWGYSIEYALSAKYNCHRNYAEYLIQKERLCMRDINNILARIESGKKAAFDKQYIEMLYENYLDVKTDDTEAVKRVKEQIKDKMILIIAPGSSISRNKKDIDEYMRQHSPFVIMSNFYDSSFNADAAFFSNLRRYEKYIIGNKAPLLWTTSNIIQAKDCSDCVFDFWRLVYDGRELVDNSIIIILKLLIQVGVKEVAIAGMDGYQKTENYATNFYAGRNNDSVNKKNNELISKCINNIRLSLSIKFITESIYE